MTLRPKSKHTNAPAVQKRIDTAARSGGKFVTEEELARILGVNVKEAVKKAMELKFTRIPVKGTHYYSKRQVQAYLSGECKKF